MDGEIFVYEKKKLRIRKYPCGYTCRWRLKKILFQIGNQSGCIVVTIIAYGILDALLLKNTIVCSAVVSKVDLAKENSLA